MSTSLAEQSLPRRAWSAKTNNFLGGFSSLFRSLPLSVFPPRKSLWEQTGDDIRECWQEVGDDLRVAMNTHEREQGHKIDIRSQRVVLIEDANGVTVKVREKEEAWRFSKHFETLDPDMQKFLLALARDIEKD